MEEDLQLPCDGSSMQSMPFQGKNEEEGNNSIENSQVKSLPNSLEKGLDIFNYF